MADTHFVEVLTVDALAMIDTIQAAAATGKLSDAEAAVAAPFLDAAGKWHGHKRVYMIAEQHAALVKLAEKYSEKPKLAGGDDKKPDAKKTGS